MKRLFIAFAAVAMMMISCDKIGKDSANVLEGQWLSEEYEGYFEFPAFKMLFDIGTKSGAGKFTMAMLAIESNDVFVEDDIILMGQGSYTYDAAKGEFYDEEVSSPATVKFLNKDKIRFTSDGIDIVFTRVSKPYSLSDMIDPEEMTPEEFELTASQDADWAGGTISFYANGEIASMRVSVAGPELTPDEKCLTVVNQEDKSVTLGLYKDSEGNIADCDLIVVATDPDGREAAYTITSNAWRPAVYTEYKGEYSEDDLSQGWSRGAECWLGAVGAYGLIEYDGVTDTFGGISFDVPGFMVAFGSKDEKVGFDTPPTNQSGTISYSYGSLTYELVIEIDR